MTIIRPNQNSQMIRSSHISIKNKRQKFHDIIRNQHHQQYMKKIRDQMLQYQQQIQHQRSLQQMDKLIRQTQQAISQDQLHQLIEQANQKDYNNAIIHIGNLIIDGKIDPRFMMQNRQKFQLRPKDSPYWLWLIRILVEENILSEQLLSYVINILKTIIKSEFGIIQGLEIIKLMIKKYEQQFIQKVLFKQQNYGIVISIKSYCYHSNKTISCLSYQIIDILIQMGDQQTKQIIKICTLQQIQKIIIIGYNKVDLHQKRFPLLILRIVNNIYSSKIQLSQKILKQSMFISLNDKNCQKTMLQVSYLWLSYFQEICLDRQALWNIFEQKKILNVIQKIITFCSNKNNIFNKDTNKQKQMDKKNNQTLQKIKNNVQKILVLILQKAGSLLPNNYAQYVQTNISVLLNAYALKLNEQKISLQNNQLIKIRENRQQCIFVQKQILQQNIGYEDDKKTTMDLE